MDEGVRAALAREITRALTLLRIGGNQSNEAYGRLVEDYLTSSGWRFAAPDDGMTAMEEGYARTVLGNVALAVPSSGPSEDAVLQAFYEAHIQTAYKTEAKQREWLASESSRESWRMTIRDMIARLRVAPPQGDHREAIWGPEGFHPGYGKGVCAIDGEPWPCGEATDG